MAGREVVSASGLTYWESDSGGTNRSVPDGNVCCACPACQVSLPSHVTVSSQSQRQPFTLSSSASDVNSRPSQSASSQQSALGYPLRSSLVGRFALGPAAMPERCIPFRSPAFPRESAHRQPPRQIPTPTPRISHAPSNGDLLPRTVYAAQTPSSSREALGTTYRPSLHGASALLFYPKRIFPAPWTLKATIRVSARVQSYTLERNLLDFKPPLAWRLPYLGIRFSIDHRDRHCMFILRIRPS